jgi:hypothetical protein
MSAIFLKKANEDLVNEQVLKVIEGQRFTVEAITLVKMLNSYKCDVVVKDDKGFRGYLVTLERAAKFEHGFRIADVKGQKLVSSYQWEEK